MLLIMHDQTAIWRKTCVTRLTRLARLARFLLDGERLTRLARLTLLALLTKLEEMLALAEHDKLECAQGCRRRARHCCKADGIEALAAMAEKRTD